MEYLLKSSGLVIILFLFYYLFLRNETFYKSIRIYFLLGLLLVVTMPLIENPVYIEKANQQMNNLNFVEATEIATNETAIDWIQILMFIYIVGLAIFSFKFLLQLASLAFLISKHQIFKKGKYCYIETEKNISPFSFFNIIIYNKSQFNTIELAQIMRHEKAHVIQWHSIDTILTHILVITLWFNPFVWLYKKATQQNLEFLADDFALKTAPNQKSYFLTLLKTSHSNYCTQISNNFYNSLIKKRITMLQKNKSANRQQWKYALLIPALIAFNAQFNTKIIAQENEKWEINTTIETVALIIDKDSSDDLLAQESAFFKTKFNIDLSFKVAKRNAANEITSIKIKAKGSDVNASFQKSGTTPIQPIKIAYDKANNSVSIGNLTENSRNNYVYIASEGKVNTWTSKTDTIVNTEKIIINKNGNKEVIWVAQKIDTSNANVKVIELNTEDKNDHITIINTGDESFKIEEDNASERVYIIKNDNGTTEKKVIKTKIVSTDNDDKPLVLVNGEEISTEEMKKINPEDIESINVLKGESAIKKHGEKAKNGVIEITKKK